MTHSRFAALVTAVLALALAVPAPLAAVTPGPPRDLPSVPREPSARSSREAAADKGYVEGELIVQYESGVAGALAQATVPARMGARAKKRFASFRGLEVVALKRGMSVEAALAAFARIPGVRYAEPNRTTDRLATVPNDTSFGYQWGLNNTGQTMGGIVGTPDADMDAPEAWNLSTGSDQVVVAIVDTGVDYTHPDLAANMWTNAGEVAGNGLDDDANGYIDDVYGIDTGDVDSDPMDEYGHGTHCAGIVGAAGNNGTGMAGVNWDVSVMAIRIFSRDLITSYAAEIEAFNYALLMGADVVNCSFGGTGSSTAVRDCIAASPQLFVCAAGNNYANNDASGFYPASYDLPNILAVAAGNNKDEKPDWSNYGATSVDAFAPGYYIANTYPGVERFAVSDGVSYATLLHDECETAATWTFSSSSGTPWIRSSYLPFAGSYSLGVYPYSNNTSSTVYIAAGLDLSSATSPWLQFVARCDTEESDLMTFGVWDGAAGTWTDIGLVSGSTNVQWKDYRVDLSAFVGRSDIHPGFRFKSDASLSGADGYDGVWVDDVRVFDVSYAETELYATDFATNAGWTNVWPDVPWVHSSSDGWWGRSPYGNNESAWLMKDAPLDLSGGNYDLTFRAACDVEPGWDSLSVYGCANGTDWDLLAEFRGIAPWTTRTVGLQRYAGDSEVWIAFALESDTMYSSDSGYTGVKIDDVRVVTSPFSRALDYSKAYVYNSGTSMAAPHAAGLAGLLLARKPGLDAAGMKAAIMSTVDVKVAFTDKCVSDGRINAYAALLSVEEAPVALDDAFATSEDVATSTVAANGVLANDSDANGDPLSASLLIGPAHGTLDLASDGSFTYTPTANYNGTDSFTYTVTAGSLTDTGTATIAIAAVNDAPVAVDDSYAATEDAATSTVSATGVLANDTDVDTDHASLTCSVLTGPAHGTLDIASDGSFTYTPATNYSGEDTFTYTASDGSLTDTATVTITVGGVNDPPVATDDNYSTDEDVPISTIAPGVLANDSDPSGAPLSCSLVTGPSHGTLELAGDGSFTYTPATNYSGTDGFTYAASDGSLTDTATVTIAINAVNDAPVAVDDAYTTAEETLLSVAADAGVLTNDTDVDADHAPLTCTVLDGPSHGTLHLNIDGSFTYRPAVDYAGPDSFTYTVSDGTLTDLGTVTFTVTPNSLVQHDIWGTDRIKTAIEISKHAFPTGGASTVIIATAYNWPDALGGSALAGETTGSILLTPAAALPAEVEAEIRRLGARRAYVLGGPSAVSAAVESRLKGMKLEVVRLAGRDRYETARRIAAEVVSLQGPDFDGTAFLATGANFPDALGASPIAAAKGWPIFLTPQSSADPLTVSAMKSAGVDHVIVLGGPTAIWPSVADAYTSGVPATVTRLSGGTRYTTAFEVAKYGVESCGLAWNKAAFATGMTFPDALAGGVLQARDGSVLLLTPSAPINLATDWAVAIRIEVAPITEVRFLGGTAVVTPVQRTTVLDLLQ